MQSHLEKLFTEITVTKKPVFKKGQTIEIKEKQETKPTNPKNVKSKEEVNSIVNRLYNSKQKQVDPNVLKS